MQRGPVVSLALAVLVLGTCTRIEAPIAPLSVEEDYLHAALFITPLKPTSPTSSVNVTRRIVNVGQVPLATTQLAEFELENRGDTPLTMMSVAVKSSHGNAVFDVVSFPTTVFPPAWADGSSGTHYRMTLGYTPEVPWEDTNHDGLVDQVEMDYAAFQITYLANGRFRTTTVHVTGYGFSDALLGLGRIEVHYDTRESAPVSFTCDNGRCTATTPLDFGIISYNLTATKDIYVENVASCPAHSPETLCDHPEYCALTLAPDRRYYDLGLGFEPSLEPVQRFTSSVVDGSQPVSLPQQTYEEQCDETSWVRLVITYQTGSDATSDSAVYIIESNDAATPAIRIPIRGVTFNIPTAVCAVLTPQGCISPLATVTLSGAGSYDPRDPTNPMLISAYRWEILSYPDGSNPIDFAATGQGSPEFGFFVPLVGSYQVRLQVTNDEGETSGDTTGSICRFDVNPCNNAIHIQQVWDNAENDQDLHLLNYTQTQSVCDQQWDCFYMNQQPIWFETFGAGMGPNPRLDIDDTNGLGPENINIDTPQPGTYRIAVHYYASYRSSPVPTVNTIRVYLNGALASEMKRSLAQDHDLWMVADVVWTDTGSSYLQPLPTDSSGTVGWVCSMEFCQDPGYECLMP